MRRQRAILILIVVPALVSLVVTLLVLTVWDRQRPGAEVLVLPTAGNTSQSPAANPPRTAVAEEPTEDTENSRTPAISPGDATDTLEGPADSSGPGCQNIVHEVSAGQVLGAIAEEYGVSVNEIVEANRLLDPLFDPNVLSVGQQLEIPTCGLPTPIPTATLEIATTRAIPTAIPTATSQQGGRVTLVIERVLFPGDITREAVDIRNTGATVDLEGWVLTDGSRARFTFPAIRLFTDGLVTVYTGVGENTASALYWGRDASVWKAGDTAYLYDADGALQAEYEIP